MRSIAASLASVTMLAHAFFGCCWHHAHFPNEGESQAVAIGAGHTHCCSHGQEVPHQDYEHNDAPHGCRGPICVFVRVDNQQHFVSLFDVTATVTIPVEPIMAGEQCLTMTSWIAVNDLHPPVPV